MNRATLTSFCCLGAIAVASATTQDTITIKRIPVKNQVLVYAMTGSMDFQGSAHEITAKQTDTISDVGADGTYTTKSEQSDLTFDGNPAPVGGGASTSVNKATGELVSIAGDSGAADQGRTATLTQFYYPTMPVKVGDTWTYEGKKDDKLGILGFKADMKLVSEEKVGAFDTWKITEEVKETVGATPATLHSTVWVDKKDGAMVKADSSFTDFPISPQIPPISGKMSFIRK